MERVRLCVCVPGGGGQGRLTATRDYVAALGDLLGYRPGPDGAVRDVARDVTGGVTRVYVASDDPEAVAEARAREEIERERRENDEMRERLGAPPRQRV